MALVHDRIPNEIWNQIFEYAFDGLREALKYSLISKRFHEIIFKTCLKCLREFKLDPFVCTLYTGVLACDALPFIKYKEILNVPEESKNLDVFEFFLKSSLLRTDENDACTREYSIDILEKVVNIERSRAADATASELVISDLILEKQPIFAMIMSSNKFTGEALDKFLIELMCSYVIDTRIFSLFLGLHPRSRALRFYFFQLQSEIDLMKLSRPKLLKRRLFFGRLIIILEMQVLSLLLTSFLVVSLTKCLDLCDIMLLVVFICDLDTRPHVLDCFFGLWQSIFLFIFYRDVLM